MCNVFYTRPHVCSARGGGGGREQGTFEHNVFHGTGVYTWADGALYDGAWYVGRMHGDGRYVDKDGVVWRGRFVNGKYDNGRVFHTLR